MTKKRMSFRPAASIPLLLIVAGLARAQSNSFNMNDFNNWEGAEENALVDSASGRPPGFGFNWIVNVCVNKVLWAVEILVVVDQNGSPTSSEHSYPVDLPCMPSVDQFGNPLTNPGTTFSPQMTNLQDTQGFSLDVPQRVRPRASGPVKPSATPPANAFTFLAPFRDIPFIPLYPVSAYPTPPPCNPSLNASILIVNHNDSAVTRLTPCTGAHTVILLPEAPLQVAATPDAAMAVVTSFSGAVSFIDLSSNKVVGTLSLPNYSPSGLAISPDGSLAYVTSFDSGTAAILVVNIASQNIVRTIPLSGYLQSIKLTPDGTMAYVVDSIDNVVEVVDLLSGTVSRMLSYTRPIGVAFNSTGTQAWITTGNNTVEVIDSATYATLKSIPVGAGPGDVTIAPDDSVAMVNNFLGNSTTFINPATFAIYNTVSWPGPPMGLALTQ